MGRLRQGQPKEVKNTFPGKCGARLESLVEAAGLSTGEIAEKLGVTPDAVLKWFRGASYPTLSKWPTLVQVLGL